MEEPLKRYKVGDNFETLRKIQEGASITRYGDGEFDVAMGGRTRLQPGSVKLANRMQEILTDNSTNILVGIPECFSGDFSKYTEKAEDFWKNYVAKNQITLQQYLNPDKEYYSSQITWFYTDYKNKDICGEFVEELKKIWKDRNILIVEGAQTRMGMGNTLFDGAKSIKRILCPAEDAFSSYDEILESCLEFPKDYLIITALGATATVLAYDLAKKGYQALDFGHVDLEYEWYLQQKGDKVPIANKFGTQISDFEEVVGPKDLKYEASIVKRIGTEPSKPEEGCEK